MWACACERLKFVYQIGLTEGMSFACSLTLNSSSTRDVLIDLKWFLANEENAERTNGGSGFTVDDLYWEAENGKESTETHSFHLKSSTSPSLMSRGWIVVRLRQSLRCQKQGWRLRQVHCVHHILMEETEGQDVVLNILEVFVNRWRHVLASVTSLCPGRGERKRMGWKAMFNFQWHEGHRDRKNERDKREINQEFVLIFARPTTKTSFVL